MSNTDPYYRRDQSAELSPPDLSKTCSYAAHIVRARGKRTEYTSVSLSPEKIKDFGDSLYLLARDKLAEDGHPLVEHEVLLAALRQAAATETKAERLRSLQALRYAKQRSEGLVHWKFDIIRLSQKDLINWAKTKVSVYLSKVK